MYNDVIKIQLNKILSEKIFFKSPSLRNFLKYVVKETLDCRQHQIKEYVIAVHVLNTKTEFNPQLNAIVRIHARRLRMLLEKYYETICKDAPVIISIPKGAFTPEFIKIKQKQRIQS